MTPKISKYIFTYLEKLKKKLFSIKLYNYSHRNKYYWGINTIASHLRKIKSFKNNSFFCSPPAPQCILTPVILINRVTVKFILFLLGNWLCEPGKVNYIREEPRFKEPEEITSKCSPLLHWKTNLQLLDAFLLLVFFLRFFHFIFF